MDPSDNNKDKMYESAKEFVERHYYSSCLKKAPSDRPFVTLTFAQSLDGKLGVEGYQLLLSGQESMAMTHQ